MVLSGSLVSKQHNICLGICGVLFHALTVDFKNSVGLVFKGCNMHTSNFWYFGGHRS